MNELFNFIVKLFESLGVIGVIGLMWAIKYQRYCYWCGMKMTQGEDVQNETDN